MNRVAMLPRAERARLLRAIGVQPLMLRRAARPAIAPPLPATARSAALPSNKQIETTQLVVADVPAMSTGTRLAGTLPLIVLLPAGAAADARQQSLLRAALVCLPQTLQRAPCVELDSHGDELPAAAAYLVLGDETRAAFGRRLSLEAQATALIEHADAPSILLAQPARKRALWRALKSLRRRFAEDN